MRASHAVQTDSGRPPTRSRLQPSDQVPVVVEEGDSLAADRPVQAGSRPATTRGPVEAAKPWWADFEEAPSEEGEECKPAERGIAAPTTAPHQALKPRKHDADDENDVPTPSTREASAEGGDDNGHGGGHALPPPHLVEGGAQLGHWGPAVEWVGADCFVGVAPADAGRAAPRAPRRRRGRKGAPASAEQAGAEAVPAPPPPPSSTPSAPLPPAPRAGGGRPRPWYDSRYAAGHWGVARTLRFVALQLPLVTALVLLPHYLLYVPYKAVVVCLWYLVPGHACWEAGEERRSEERRAGWREGADGEGWYLAYKRGLGFLVFAWWYAWVVAVAYPVGMALCRSEAVLECLDVWGGGPLEDRAAGAGAWSARKGAWTIPGWQLLLPTERLERRVMGVRAWGPGPSERKPLGTLYFPLRQDRDALAGLVDVAAVDRAVNAALVRGTLRDLREGRWDFWAELAERWIFFCLSERRAWWTDRGEGLSLNPCAGGSRRPTASSAVDVDDGRSGGGGGDAADDDDALVADGLVAPLGPPGLAATSRNAWIHVTNSQASSLLSASSCSRFHPLSRNERLVIAATRLCLNAIAAAGLFALQAPPGPTGGYGLSSGGALAASVAFGAGTWAVCWAATRVSLSTRHVGAQPACVRVAPYLAPSPCCRVVPCCSVEGLDREQLGRALIRLVLVALLLTSFGAALGVVPGWLATGSAAGAGVGAFAADLLLSLAASEAVAWAAGLLGFRQALRRERDALREAECPPDEWGTSLLYASRFLASNQWPETLAGPAAAWTARDVADALHPRGGGSATAAFWRARESRAAPPRLRGGGGEAGEAA